MQAYDIKQSTTFKKWFKKIAKPDQLRIMVRLQRIVDNGNFGDHKWFGDIGELRFFFGAGYRIYYTIRGTSVIFLLCGGDKKTQVNDFIQARKILQQISNKD